MAQQNTYSVKLNDGREVCFSYGVPVAAFIPGQGFIRTSARYSVTTSKHANAYCGGRDVKQVDDATFRMLILPVESGSR